MSVLCWVHKPLAASPIHIILSVEKHAPPPRVACFRVFVDPLHDDFGVSFGDWCISVNDRFEETVDGGEHAQELHAWLENYLS